MGLKWLIFLTIPLDLIDTWFADDQRANIMNRDHSRLGYYFWDKKMKDFVALDLDIYHDLLLFDQ